MSGSTACLLIFLLHSTLLWKNNIAISTPAPKLTRPRDYRIQWTSIVIAIAWKALELDVLQRSGIIQQWIYVALVFSLSVDSYYCFSLLAVVDLFKSFIFGWLNLDTYLGQGQRRFFRFCNPSAKWKIGPKEDIPQFNSLWKATSNNKSQ